MHSIQGTDYSVACVHAQRVLWHWDVSNCHMVLTVTWLQTVAVAVVAVVRFTAPGFGISIPRGCSWSAYLLTHHVAAGMVAPVVGCMPSNTSDSCKPLSPAPGAASENLATQGKPLICCC